MRPAPARVPNAAHPGEMFSVIMFLCAILALGGLAATGNNKVKEAPAGGIDKQFLHDAHVFSRFALFMIWMTLSAVQLFVASTTRMEVMFGTPFTVSNFFEKTKHEFTKYEPNNAGN